mmetsp:Transcript_19658/g.18733  ORF Transcript_19658/g.18733 Transcript_19658/m.18733 type:complete len:216 (+) Transcript_19658:629-1276(+)
MVVIVTALFTVILYYNIDDTLQGVQNRNGALFFITLNIALLAIQSIILIFPDERPVFLREVNNNMYDVGPYFVAKVTSELPAAFFCPILYGVIVYFAINLSTVFAYKFPLFLAILVNIYICAGSYALIISSLFSDKQLAVTLTPILIVPFMLFAGYFVNQDNIPVFLIEFMYISFFKYGFQALMLNEYQDLFLECMGLPGTSPQRCDPLGNYNSP